MQQRSTGKISTRLARNINWITVHFSRLLSKKTTGFLILGFVIASLITATLATAPVYAAPPAATPPTISIADASIVEGDSYLGTTPMTFTVTLSAAYDQTVTVNYATSDGTAVTNARYDYLNDYIPASGTLTFTPGQISQTITVQIKNDRQYEPDETFSVTLSAPTNATLNRAVATGTIINNDSPPYIWVTGYNTTERNSSSLNYVLSVRLSEPSAYTITVKYKTVDGTATVADNDYTAGSGTATFSPGYATVDLDIAVIGDTKFEPDEYFTLVLSNPTNATLQSSSYNYTIQNDDSRPTVSIGNVTKAEGNSGTTSFSFPVTLSNPSYQTITVDYATADGTATAGSDYTALTGTVSFAPGETSKNVTVLVNGDTTNEAAETFTVTLSNPTNTTISTATATGTISNDDAVPNLSISSPTVSEGNSGTTTASFTVNLDAASGQTVTVNYATADGTATTTDGDYLAKSSTLTFAPGVTSQTIDVTVNGDTKFETNETFTVTLSSPTNAAITTAIGTGTITNDDSQPTVSIGNVTKAEGNTGTTSFDFTISLSNTSDQTISVDYATADGTATAGSDYTAVPTTTLTFAPGQTSKTVTVLINGDATDEPDETFALNLTNPVNATVQTATATGTISNDDAAPALSINSVTKAEGNSNTTSFDFVVTLSPVSGKTVTVSYATADGTATTADNDYTALASTTLTFAPGETTKTVTVFVNGDNKFETNETFTVNLNSPTNATLVSGLETGTGTITNDDAQPTLTIDSVSVLEGNSNTTAANFSVTLSNPSYQTITVNYATADGTATTADSDYQAVTTTTLTFAPGETVKPVAVLVNGDTKNETDETFTVSLSGATNATISGTGSGTATITNDDALPSLSINSTSVTEGNSSTATASFTVTLSAISGQTVTVSYQTADGTATTADSDYAAVPATLLTFAPGETTKTVTVSVNGDNKFEPDETFTVILSGASNASIANASGTGTITNDDSQPSISVTNVSQPEGTATNTNFNFTVMLSSPSYQTVTVNYATADGTATVADNDYTAIASSVLTFAPGEISKTVTVVVKADAKNEADETLTLNLSGATNATIATNTATGTIINDDGVPALFISDVMVAEGNNGTTQANFTVTLGTVSGQTVTVDYATADGTATTADSDYQAASGTLTFAPGDTTKTITVLINGDTKFEPSETFTVSLSNATKVAIDGTGVATATITNDDTTPALTINNVTKAEGNSGTTNFSFTVSLSNSSYQPVTVNYTTSDNTATLADNDYQAASGTLTFAPGDISKTVTVLVNGDTKNEADETFSVNLSSATNAIISVSSGSGTISNDDVLPTLSVSSPSVLEGNSGTASLVFNVALSGVSGQTVKVNYATADGTATTADNDYQQASGTLTFAPGETTKTVTVLVKGDTKVEPSETLTLNLSGAINATIVGSIGTGTITSDDVPLVSSYSSTPAIGSTINLGSVVGSSTSTVITVKNSGGANLTVSAPILAGANAAAFTITPATSYDVAANGTQTVTIRCTAAVTAYTATLTYTTNDITNATVSYNLSCSGVTPPAASFFKPITPARLYDSRSDSSPIDAPLGREGVLSDGQVRTIKATGNLGIPVGATAIMANVTVAGAQGGGFLKVFPANLTTVDTAAVNWYSSPQGPGARVVGNFAIIGLDTSGQFKIAVGGGTTDVIIDVSGYLVPDPNGAGVFKPLATNTNPRLYDTRAGGGGLSGQNSGKLKKGDTPRTLKISGAGSLQNIPVSATAVVVNVTVVATEGSGYVTLYPADSKGVPVATNVNWQNWRAPNTNITHDVGNMAIVPLSIRGEINFVVDGTVESAADVVIDVMGYIDTASGANSGFQLPLATQLRLYDSRANSPAYPGSSEKGILASGISRVLKGAGVLSVPAGAKAVLVRIATVDVSGGGFLALFSSAVWPGNASVNTNGANQVIGNLAIVTLDAGGNFKVQTGGQAMGMVIDIIAYFL